MPDVESAPELGQSGCLRPYCAEFEGHFLRDGWSRGLEVTGGGQGVVSHAGLARLRHRR